MLFVVSPVLDLVVLPTEISPVSQLLFRLGTGTGTGTGTATATATATATGTGFPEYDGCF